MLERNRLFREKVDSRRQKIEGNNLKLSYVSKFLNQECQELLRAADRSAAEKFLTLGEVRRPA